VEEETMTVSGKARRFDRGGDRPPPERVLRPRAYQGQETFTPAENTLIARGEADGIQDIRRRFQRSIFILADARTDMSGFEEADEDEGGPA
jgi:hypothetical protein